MSFSEARQIAKLLAEEWDLGKRMSRARGDVCAWIYFFEIMEESEKVILEKKDKKVIGICGYTKCDSDKYKFRKKIYGYLKKSLINSFWIRDKEAIYKYYNNYDYTPKEFDDYFDGEVSIIIIDKKYRGCGIGRKMLNKIFEYAREDNMKNLKILTDESCNFIFYEKMGCQKIYEKVIQNEEPNKCGDDFSEIGYIYEKKLR